MIFNRNDMAAVLGVAATTLDIRRKGGLPGEKKGKEWEFDSVKVIAFLVKEASKGSATSKRGDVDLRIALTEAETKEYKLGELRGELMRVADVDPLFEEQNAIITSRVKAIPARMAQKLAVEEDPGVILRLLKDEVAEALDGIGGAELDDPDKGKRGFQFEDGEDGPVLTDDGY